MESRGRAGSRGEWLALLLMLAVCMVIVDSAGVRIRNDADGARISLSPCDGAACIFSQLIKNLISAPTTSNNNNNNNNRRTVNAASLPLPLSPRRHPSRTRRQSVVVEVDEEEVEVEGSHRVKCTRRERRKTACLNGKCFALDMGDLRTPFCKCPAKYEGPRCERLSTYYFLNYYASLQKGAIIGGVIIGIILIIVAVSVYCSYRKGRKRRKERKNKPDIWNTATPQPAEKTSMIADGESRFDPTNGPAQVSETDHGATQTV